MAPTLLSGQLVQSRPFDGLTAGTEGHRGRIVALRHPQRHEAIYVKRVIGLPNEYVTVGSGVVTVDERKLDEPYLLNGLETRSRGATRWFTGADEVFVLGDNRMDSEDSRVFGPVPVELIIGEVWFRYFPAAWLR